MIAETIALPSGHFNRVYILAASTGGDQHATFRIGQRSTDLTIEDWGLGMTAEQLDEANALLAKPLDIDLSISQRLGFHVDRKSVV